MSNRCPTAQCGTVRVNAILNLDVYLETVKVCGRDGSACLPTGDKPAPVCDAITDNKLIPNADVISTFSLYLESTIPIGQTPCPQARYVGCTTAPCKETGDTDPATGLPLVSCARLAFGARASSVRAAAEDLEHRATGPYSRRELSKNHERSESRTAGCRRLGCAPGGSMCLSAVQRAVRSPLTTLWLGHGDSTGTTRV